MIRRLIPYAGEYKNHIILCVIFTVGEVSGELLIPLTMAKIVDVGIPSGSLPYMAGMGALMVLMSAIAILFGVGTAKLAAEASQGFAANVRKAQFDRISTFSFANIDHYSSASLITRMTNDVTQLQNATMMSMRILTRAPIMLVSALIVAVSINGRLSLVILAAIMVLAAIIPVIMRCAGKLFANLQKKLDGLNGTVQENLVGIRVVKAFVREGYEKTKFGRANDELMAAGLKAGYLMALLWPLMMLVMNGTTLGVIWLGGRFVGSGSMTTGALMSFISYIMQILMSIMMFSMVFVMLSRARASGERVVEILETEPTIRDYPDAVSGDSPKVTRGKVEFQDVSFRYGEDGDVLSHVSFTAEPGQVMGIVGGTGSGKTSLINLIPRFYDVTGGRVLVDGLDVKDYAQSALREGIGMVMQKNNLFSGTIRENLLWGDENAAEEQIAAAARNAQADGFIRGIGGYDAELGQGGVNVSGGQKQRLCIARAMLKKPRILILDDSTSAVDTATETKIRRSLREEMKGCTVIVVAQRISSVRDADQILVLDDGAIAGVGTHDELLQSSDIYREICMSQMEGGTANG